MDDIEWKPLPSLWPSPAVSTDLGEFMLLVFTQDGAPIWEVCLRAEVVGGGADTFEAAKAAALFEARARSHFSK
jgi:hypothetical protein